MVRIWVAVIYELLIQTYALGSVLTLPPEETGNKDHAFFSPQEVSQQLKLHIELLVKLQQRQDQTDQLISKLNRRLHENENVIADMKQQLQERDEFIKQLYQKLHQTDFVNNDLGEDRNSPLTSPRYNFTHPSTNTSIGYEQTLEETRRQKSLKNTTVTLSQTALREVQQVRWDDIGQTRVGAVSSSVAFFAVLSHNIEDPNEHFTVPFDRIITNVGGALNKHGTGVFTCNIPGIYVFSWSVSTRGHQMLFGQLVKNGVVISTVTTGRDEIEYSSGSGTAIITLEVDDDVYIWISDPRNSADLTGFTKFSGFLLK